MIIENMKGDMSALADKPIIITGGGGGIALEAGLALAYMGAKVIIGEVDEEKGRKAEKTAERRPERRTGGNVEKNIFLSSLPGSCNIAVY